jgi:hypothetical protein
MEAQLSMSLADVLIFFGRYLWPLLLAWNIYLYRQIQSNQRSTFEDRLAMARDYASKRDLEKMFEAMESRIDTRLEQLFCLFQNK